MTIPQYEHPAFKVSKEDMIMYGPVRTLHRDPPTLDQVSMVERSGNMVAAAKRFLSLGIGERCIRCHVQRRHKAVHCHNCGMKIQPPPLSKLRPKQDETNRPGPGFSQADGFVHWLGSVVGAPMKWMGLL